MIKGGFVVRDILIDNYFIISLSLSFFVQEPVLPVNVFLLSG